jgi:hypothetical protein
LEANGVDGVLEGCDSLDEKLTPARKASADARAHSPAEFFSGEPLGEIILEQAMNEAFAAAPTPVGEQACRHRDNGHPEDDAERCHPVHDFLAVPGQNRQ